MERGAKKGRQGEERERARRRGDVGANGGKTKHETRGVQKRERVCVCENTIWDPVNFSLGKVRNANRAAASSSAGSV